jgi:hypothetical protein
MTSATVASFKRNTNSLLLGKGWGFSGGGGLVASRVARVEQLLAIQDLSGVPMLRLHQLQPERWVLERVSQTGDWVLELRT